MTATLDERTTIVTPEYTIGQMSTLDRTGDTKIMWDSRNTDEVTAARKLFNELVKKGYRAYKAKGEKGEKGDQITEFDPTAERILLFPRLVGG